MKKLFNLLAIPFITLMGMFGGQKKKAVRRFGITIYSVLHACLYDGFEWSDLAFLLLIPILSMGYGVDSTIMSLIGLEWAVRVVYALLLSIPFFFKGWLRGIIAGVFLIGAFQVRAGSLGFLSWFGDILIEDIIRYGTLSILIISNILIKRKK